MIAQTITQQLGPTTLALLGAHMLVSLGDGLQFRIKGSDQANLIQIILDPCDTYTVKFWKITETTETLLPDLQVTTLDWHQVHSVSDVYWDMLHDIIADHTGLATRL